MTFANLLHGCILQRAGNKVSEKLELNEHNTFLSKSLTDLQYFELFSYFAQNKFSWFVLLHMHNKEKRDKKYHMSQAASEALNRTLNCLS